MKSVSRLMLIASIVLLTIMIEEASTLPLLLRRKNSNGRFVVMYDQPKCYFHSFAPGRRDEDLIRDGLQIAELLSPFTPRPPPIVLKEFADEVPPYERLATKVLRVEVRQNVVPSESKERNENDWLDDYLGHHGAMSWRDARRRQHLLVRDEETGLNEDQIREVLALEADNRDQQQDSTFQGSFSDDDLLGGHPDDVHAGGVSFLANEPRGIVFRDDAADGAQQENANKQAPFLEETALRQAAGAGGAAAGGMSGAAAGGMSGPAPGGMSGPAAGGMSGPSGMLSGPSGQMDMAGSLAASGADPLLEMAMMMVTPGSSTEGGCADDTPATTSECVEECSCSG